MNQNRCSRRCTLYKENMNWLINFTAYIADWQLHLKSLLSDFARKSPWDSVYVCMSLLLILQDPSSLLLQSRQWFLNFCLQHWSMIETQHVFNTEKLIPILFILPFPSLALKCPNKYNPLWAGVCWIVPTHPWKRMGFKVSMISNAYLFSLKKYNANHDYIK